MRVGGFVPFSTVDCPDRLSAVVFCQGCPWQCRYCHNTHLIPFRKGKLDWQVILGQLEKRRGLLDMVIFSGGEPTMQADLSDAIQQVRGLGYEIGLHTGGAYPSRLLAVLPLVNWVGMDVKSVPSRYAAITGKPLRADLWESIEAVIQSGVPHEFRTTVHPALHSIDEIRWIADELARRGAQRFVVQKFRDQGCITLELTGEIADEWLEEIRSLGIEVR